MWSSGPNSFSVAILVLVLLAASLACDASSNQVRIATEGAYPPYNDLNEAGDIIGFDRVLGDELCRRAELRCIWVVYDWDKIIPSLLEEEYDAIIAGMTITEERDQLIDFTQPYVPPSPSVYVARATADTTSIEAKLNDPIQKSGLQLAAQGATIHSNYLAGKGLHYTEYDTVPHAIDGLLRDEIEVVFAGSRFVRDSLAQHEDKMVIVGPEVLIGHGVGIGVRESDVDLKETLDQAITSMKDDGSLNDLIREWFGPKAQTFRESLNN